MMKLKMYLLLIHNIAEKIKNKCLLFKYFLTLLVHLISLVPMTVYKTHGTGSGYRIQTQIIRLTVCSLGQ